MSDNVYLGNPNLKKANTAIEFTQEQIYEFMRCKEDPVYFANNYTGNFFMKKIFNFMHSAHTR